MRDTNMAPTSPTSTPRRWFPYLLLVVSAASWGANWAVARAALQEIPPYALVFWRLLFACLILFPFAARHLRGDLPAAVKHWGWIVFFGIAGVAGFPILGYLGLHYTTATNAALLNTSVPLFIVPMAWLVRGHTIRAVQLAGLALSLAGALTIVSAGKPAAIVSLALNPGDLLILLAVALWALYTVLLHHRPRMHSLSFLFFTLIAGLAFCVPFYVFEVLTVPAVTVTAKLVAAIAYLGLFSSVVAYVCWNHAVPLVGPNVAGFFNPLVPVFGTLSAVLLLGEQIHGYHLAGFVLVLGGVLLTSRS
jgi:drug/metabolite transporter (DMT)-like permease